MLTLAEKVQNVLYVAPIAAFLLGMMWKRATYELEQEWREKQ